jgi:hypothetical protein
MIEGRPRESLVQYENPIEVTTTYSLKPLQISAGQDPKDPFKKTFGCKSLLNLFISHEIASKKAIQLYFCEE